MLHIEPDTHLHAATQCARTVICCLISALLAAAVGCGSSPQIVPETGFRAQLGAQHPLIGQVYRGQIHVTRDAVLFALGAARYVVLGETHDNPDHHQLQAQLLTHFLTEQPGAAVAFEMLDEDDAVALAQDPPVRASSELAKRVGWADSGWPEFTMYQPIFDAAFSARARIIAAHPNAEHLRASMRGIDDNESRDLRIDIPLPEAQIQAQHDEIRASHCGHANDQMLRAMQRAQVYKDAFMARALTRTQSPTALIAGRGHARNDRAVPYFLQRAQAGTTVSIAFVEVRDDQLDPSAYEIDPFDYVIFTPRVSDEDPCEKFRKQLEQMRQHPQGA